MHRALVSVYDKAGLIELAEGLHKLGVEIVSTGSTAQRIADAGVPVTPVEELTGFPECLDGRVKTLHPRVHAGLLADTRRPEHTAQLDELGIAPFELLVANLYPFTATVASGAAPDECVEQIDIGGPRWCGRAPRTTSVAVVVDPERYTRVLDQVEAGGFTLDDRRRARRRRLPAHRHLRRRRRLLAGQRARARRRRPVPGLGRCDLGARRELRYGENPHQAAALYTAGGAGWRERSSCTARRCRTTTTPTPTPPGAPHYDHGAPTVAVIKHANPAASRSAPTSPRRTARRTRATR